jgi:hypothetical protein
MKKEFYPRVDKRDAFKLGYIAEKSGHTRGSTIDLTIAGLDMGTTYDFFDELAHTANPNVSAEARRNRLLLKSVMEKFGFRGYEYEWWHFTLANEPFPGYLLRRRGEVRPAQHERRQLGLAEHADRRDAADSAADIHRARRARDEIRRRTDPRGLTARRARRRTGGGSVLHACGRRRGDRCAGFQARR